MTDIARPNGLQGSATVIADRKPWKAPRLIPIDDTDTDGKNSDSQEGTRNGRMIFWKKDPDPAS